LFLCVCVFVCVRSHIRLCGVLVRVRLCVCVLCTGEPQGRAYVVTRVCSRAFLRYLSE
jgi:hypothetical protein